MVYVLYFFYLSIIPHNKRIYHTTRKIFSNTFFLLSKDVLTTRHYYLLKSYHVTCWVSSTVRYYILDCLIIAFNIYVFPRRIVEIFSILFFYRCWSAGPNLVDQVHWFRSSLRSFNKHRLISPMVFITFPFSFKVL